VRAKVWKVLKIGAFGLGLCFLASASLDLVKVNPDLCRHDQVCPSIGTRLDVRWNDVETAIDAIRERQKANVTPAVERVPAGERTLSVMVYNIKGLPESFRGNTHPDAFTIIGKNLAARRRAGTAPDIVLIQEAFTHRSREIAALSGYKHMIRGPLRPGADTAWIARPLLYIWKAAWDRSVRLEGRAARSFRP
jgi:hypothetical protein